MANCNFNVIYCSDLLSWERQRLKKINILLCHSFCFNFLHFLIYLKVCQNIFTIFSVIHFTTLLRHLQTHVTRFDNLNFNQILYIGCWMIQRGYAVNKGEQAEIWKKQTVKTVTRKKKLNQMLSFYLKVYFAIIIYCILDISNFVFSSSSLSNSIDVDTFAIFSSTHLIVSSSSCWWDNGVLLIRNLVSL